MADAGLSRAALAERVGITPQRLGHYLASSREPPLDVLARISTSLRIPSDYIIGIRDDAVSASPTIPSRGRASRANPFKAIAAALDLPEDAGEAAIAKAIGEIRSKPDRVEMVALSDVEAALSRQIDTRLSALAKIDASNDNRVPVALREVDAAAGFGVEVFGEEIERFLTFDREWLQRKSLDHTELQLIRVKGDSMEPTLRDRDVILIDTRPAEMLPGHIYVVRRDNDLVVKRAGREGDAIQLTSDNPAYPPMKVLEDGTLIGRVAWSARSYDL